MSTEKKSTTIKYHYPENVSIAGTFTEWKPELMNFDKQNNENFIQVENKDLQRLIFKFVINGEWKTSEKYPTVSDSSGNLNNYCNISDELQNGGETVKLLNKPSVETLDSYKSLKNTDSNSDQSSASIEPDDDTCVDSTSHGTNDESLLKRIWIWIKAFICALF